VCAVSFLNTVPLIWGLERGPQREAFDLSFSVPSVCADRLARRDVDIGLVPCAELDRLELDFFPEVGIACRGPVRSILLVSKVPPDRIRTLAADVSSRSSVMLCRILLAERYRVFPEPVAMSPHLESMLAVADAALIIGDPALKLDPETLPYHVLDLGAEWVSYTGLPMVFAVWAGRPEHITPQNGRVFLDSWHYGRDHLEDIVSDAEARAGVPAVLARKYLTSHIAFELGERERAGLALYRQKSSTLVTLSK
jgi:predicted solute-binding protein